MNDKDVEKYRYDDRALKLSSNDFFDKDNGSSSFPSPIRSPYLRYEEMHIEFIDSNDNVLEIGAGTGAHTHSLLETGAFVVATDISPNSVQIIKKKYKEYSDKLSTKVADMESLPFNNETFDVVCSAGSLSYGDNQVVMNEINRVLKPDGKVIIVDSLHENPLYIINRWIGYYRGTRSLSTIKRMPTLKLIRKYEDKFNLKKKYFFGSLTWLSPIFIFFLRKELVGRLFDRFDTLINVKRSAFKFVVVLQKKTLI
jgi:ubiquinone/menaquinone biosynthesis C-methylase UbiE